MKKIDFHIHTVATSSDSNFDFSIEKLKQYVSTAELDAIAITNHNMFDAGQFRLIEDNLTIPVFPGIEVNLESSHVLLITDSAKCDVLDAASRKVEERVSVPSEHLSVDELIDIFGNLNDYLVIPHYDKKPVIRSDTLSRLIGHITAGEVDSAKKFIRCVKDKSRLAPVLFSDARISDDLVMMPTRATFIDCGDLTLPAIRMCLESRDKVSLSERDGNKVFQVLDSGLMMSTGLNVLLGDRSSGKTYTLNRISREQSNVKYIEQFSLVQRDEAAYEKEFNSEIERRRSRFTDDYLGGFKGVLDEIIGVDLAANDRSVNRYIETLLRSAEEAERMDAYSKASLFSETTFKVGDDTSLKDLIGSVRQLIENVDYREIIQRHLEQEALRALACELIETLWERSIEKSKRHFVNGLVSDIKRSLGVRSSAVQVEDVDLYQIALEAKKVERFDDIVRGLRSEEVIFEDDMQGFKVVAKKRPHDGAGELKSTSGRRVSFMNAMGVYEEPYQFLQELLEIEALSESELYRYFVKISYEILNKDGFRVSGGERSEFRLLQEISDAQNYDILLIDEPESSFDNMFLKSDVNTLIKEISRTMPVVVVTHNSTVGATVGADYILYAMKESTGGRVQYKIYNGHPTDKTLVCVDGTSVPSHSIMMNSLEAGKDAYEFRRRGYEAIED